MRVAKNEKRKTGESPLSRTREGLGFHPVIRSGRGKGKTGM